MYWCTKYGLQHDINSFALRRSWGGHENTKMVFAELNCHVFNVYGRQNTCDSIAHFFLPKYSILAKTQLRCRETFSREKDVFRISQESPLGFIKPVTFSAFFKYSTYDMHAGLIDSKSLIMLWNYTTQKKLRMNCVYFIVVSTSNACKLLKD